MSSGIDSTRQANAEYHGYFSTYYAEELLKKIVPIRNKIERDKFIVSHLLPNLASDYIKSIDLKEHAIIIYFRGNFSSKAFHGIDKIREQRGNIIIDTLTLEVNNFSGQIESDTKCFIFTVPAGTIKGTEQKGKFIPTNIILTEQSCDILSRTQFLGFDYDHETDHLDIDLSDDKSTLLQVFSRNALKQYEIASTRQRYKRYIECANIALKEIYGVYLGGICEAKLDFPYESALHPVIVRRSVSYP
jgi:hypothetical protein